MKRIERTRNEYGGFLPLELTQGEELFAKYEKILHRFNSVKASLAYLLTVLDSIKIYMPFYYCPSTIEAVKKLEIEICFYHVDSNLMPLDVPDEKGSCILLVDYFGVRGKQTEEYARSFKYAEVIIDRAHSFYAKPLVGQRIHNIYSAKKFFGVPDGSYLVSMNIASPEQIPTDAYEYAGYLTLAYERGTNAAYEMKKEADRVLAGKYGCMSILTIGLMRNADYIETAKRRRENYRILHSTFRYMNELELPEECIAYQYPLLVTERGSFIKQRLVEDKIFVPTLWSGAELMKNGNAFELNMSKHCIFLPIDQRYNEWDMRYITGRVKELINENT